MQSITTRRSAFGVALLLVFSSLAMHSSVAAQAPSVRQAAGGPTEIVGTAKPTTVDPLYGRLRAASVRSRTNKQADVRAFVDTVFGLTGFDNAAESLKGRVTAAELQYRIGGQAAIPVTRLVAGVNRTATVLGRQSYFRTSTAQVQLERQITMAHVPRDLWDDDDNPEVMSPTESVFLILFLTEQKYLNGLYQKDPDKWAAAERALQASHPRPELLKARAKLAHQKSNLSEFKYLRSELASEDSDMVHGAHELLTSIGLKK